MVHISEEVDEAAERAARIVLTVAESLAALLRERWGDWGDVAVLEMYRHLEHAALNERGNDE